mmetsp:Transcript_8054/g.18836  ORF Transcript_8054/g.18836 Transcript_8054/m.18836 type:complete len:423 (-) Transcript_8054:148-1416(-)
MTDKPHLLPTDEQSVERLEGLEKAADLLLQVERSQTVFKLEKSSVYGSAVAFPQIARSSGYKTVFVTLWLRSWMALAVNYLVQGSLVMLVGEATQIMAPLGGQMHLCDFGAHLDECEGPGGTWIPECTGPGGTQFAPPRLYGYTQWAVQKFIKQALLDVVPDQEEVINDKVDPGEYGLENRGCRWLCLFLFVLSVNHEIQVCLRMLMMLWWLPSNPGESEWIVIKDGNVKYRIAGMPCIWKFITFLVVFIPKLALVHFVLLEGTLLLMDSSGILDTILGAMSLSFILDVDEMLHSAMITNAGLHVLDKIEDMEEKPGRAAEVEASETAAAAADKTSWWPLVRQLIPVRLVIALVVMAFFTGRYYEFKCVYKEDLNMFVSKDMYLPKRASYSFTDFIFNGLFHTVGKSEEPFWTMPTPEHLLK